MSPQLLTTLLSPLVPAFLAILGVWWKDQRDRRNHDIWRRQVLERATKEVEFIDLWIQAYARIAQPHEQEQAHKNACRDLNRTYVAVSDTILSDWEVVKPATFGLTIKSVLLIGRAKTAWAKIWRLLYYVALFLWSPLWIAGAFSLAGGLNLINILTGICGIAIGSLIPLWVLHLLVRRASSPPAGKGHVVE